MLAIVTKEMLSKMEIDDIYLSMYKYYSKPYIALCKDNKYKVTSILFSPIKKYINGESYTNVEIGYNHNPLDEDMRDENGNTKPEVLHAEEHVIQNAGIIPDNSTLIVNYAPCPHCAGVIISTQKIKRVIYDKLINKHVEGIEILKRAGIEVVQKNFHLEELYDEFK